MILWRKKEAKGTINALCGGVPSEYNPSTIDGGTIGEDKKGKEKERTQDNTKEWSDDEQSSEVY